MLQRRRPTLLPALALRPKSDLAAMKSLPDVRASFVGS